MHLALFQPSIPPNTGNIGRLCVGMGATLHLIGPIAFDLSDKAVRRAGLDYWPNLSLEVHDSPEAFLRWLGPRQPWLVTKFGAARLDQPAYAEGDVIVLGNEVRGLPPEWIERWRPRSIYIPILGAVRSYNLANAAAMVLCQAKLRAGAFEGAGPAKPPT